MPTWAANVLPGEVCLCTTFPHRDVYRWDHQARLWEWPQSDSGKLSNDSREGIGAKLTLYIVVVRCYWPQHFDHLLDGLPQFMELFMFVAECEAVGMIDSISKSRKGWSAHFSLSISKVKGEWRVTFYSEKIAELKQCNWFPGFSLWSVNQ